MIAIENISKTFGTFKALNDVSLSLQRGTCVALIGPNGSGKTTLSKAILGMVKPQSGRILFDGKDVSSAWRYRNEVGYMPQIGRYPENMTIGQVVNMMKDIRRMPEASLDNDLIKAFGLHDLFAKRMRTLSGGTRQKVSACLAFLFDPKVLILDEPTAGLDPIAAELLKEKIKAEKRKGKLIVITSHVLSELDDLVTEVVYMQEGRPLFHRSLQQLHDETGEQKLSKAIAQVVTGYQLIALVK